jgi:hypothetical protein
VVWAPRNILLRGFSAIGPRIGSSRDHRISRDGATGSSFGHAGCAAFRLKESSRREQTVIVRRRLLILLAIAVVVAIAFFALESGKPRPGKVLDEARLAGRDVASFAAGDPEQQHDPSNLSARERRARLNLSPTRTSENDCCWLVSRSKEEFLSVWGL